MKEELCSIDRPMRYTGIMTRGEVKEILNRVLTWSDDDQKKIVRFVREMEQWRADHDLIDEAGEQADSGHRNR
jgi:hypothetical protein